MKELQTICESKLGDADLHIELESEFNNIDLVFIPGDDPTEEVVIECRGVHSFKMIKDPEEELPYFVGGVQVSEASDSSEIKRILSAEEWTWGETQLPERLYEIRVKGGIDVFIVCTQTRVTEKKKQLFDKQ